MRCDYSYKVKEARRLLIFTYLHGALSEVRQENAHCGGEMLRCGDYLPPFLIFGLIRLQAFVFNVKPMYKHVFLEQILHLKMMLFDYVNRCTSDRH